LPVVSIKDYLPSVIPAKAGIQKNKSTWIPGQARNDKIPGFCIVGKAVLLQGYLLKKRGEFRRICHEIQAPNPLKLFTFD
jgi:hypothetical protein